MPATYVNAETPSQAVDLLAQRYGEAVEALRGALDRFLNDGVAPTPEIRALFRYPRLRVTYRPDGATPANPRAFAKFKLKLSRGELVPFPSWLVLSSVWLQVKLTAVFNIPVLRRTLTCSESYQLKPALVP